MKYIILICDGMADIETEEHPETPVEAAETPNFDKISELGKNGRMYTVRKGFAPGSDQAHLSLLGYNLDKYYTGRGPMEALGAGIDLEHGEVAFRANIATIDDNFNVIDRRAGRIKEGFDEIVEAVNSIDLPIDFEFHHTVEHRGVLVLKEGSADITKTDPHEPGKKVLHCEPTKEGKEAERTADIINEFTKKTNEVMEGMKVNKGREKPANVIILRGPGKHKKVPSFEEMQGLKGACIAKMTVVRGAAVQVGMDLLEVEGSTGGPDTNIENKFNKALSALGGEYDLVLMNIKATDLFGHDGDFEGKKKMIEKIDSKLPILMKELDKYTMAFTADHATPVSVMDHSADPVMVSVAGPSVESDEVKTYSETKAKNGALGTFLGKKLMDTIKNYS